MPVSVALQARPCLLRAGLARRLAADPDLVLVGAWETAPPLWAAARRHQLDAAVLDADATDWDVAEIASFLRRRHPSITLVGLHGGTTAAVAPRLWDAVLPVTTAVDRLVDALHGDRAAYAEDRPALSARERALVELVARGATASEIAGSLCISRRTVDGMRARVFDKLGVQSAAQAVGAALSLDLVRPENT